jgi:hypothetical protein
MEDYDGQRESIGDYQDMDMDIEDPESQEDNGDQHAIPVKKLDDMFDDVDVEVVQPTEKRKKLSEDTNKSGKESLKVYLRVRPMIGSDMSTIKESGANSIVTVAPVSSNRAKYTRVEERQYSFHKVFGPDSSQDDVFKDMVSPLMTRFTSGHSCVAFAYGMTNSGKTHTIQGTSADPGALPKLVSSVLNTLEGKQGWKLNLSMLEIHQEKVYDLLGKKKEKLNLRDVNGRIDVPKLTSHEVLSIEESFTLMSLAAKNRSKSWTRLNSGSSRSHAVYSLTLSQLVDDREVSSVFLVVDLAGAERGNRTKASKAQQQEANSINTSLMQLWRCLTAMKKRDAFSGDGVVSFRESKLTHLLMPYLGRAGLGGIAMMACINPQPDDYDETLSILTNASLAVTIKDICDFENRKESQQGHRATQSSSSLYDRSATAPAGQAATSRREKAQMAAMASKKESYKRTSSLISEMTMDTALKVEDAALALAEANAIAAAAEGASDKAKATIAALKQEIETLRAENEDLHVYMMERETEIRIEVAQEMAERSQHLLDRITELQDELHEQSSAAAMDVTKSVKKLRKQQMHLNNAEAVADLKEVEEELLRTRTQFEEEVNELTEENKGLEEQVKEWRDKAERAEKALELYTSTEVMSRLSAARSSTSNTLRSSEASGMSMSIRQSEGTASIVSSMLPVGHGHDGPFGAGIVITEAKRERVSAEDAFSKRMQRDGRFQSKPSGIKSPMKSPVKSPGGGKSSRSPLRAVKGSQGENSPLTLSMSTRAIEAGVSKKRTSGESMGEAGESGQGKSKRPYLSRLRSQFSANA